jgi:hypothetical protein
LLVQVLAEREHFFNLGNGDAATAVSVKHSECSLKFVVAQQILLIHCGHHKF